MILQLFSALSGLGSLFGQSAAPTLSSNLSNFGSQLLGSLSSGLQQGIQQAIPNLVSSGVNLLNRELQRDARNEQKDLIKAALRIQANAISPTVAPGQGPVFSGGPATGGAYLPSTVLPPSIVSPRQVLQTNPEFSRVVRTTSQAVSSAGQPLRVNLDASQPVDVTNVGLISSGVRAIGRLGSQVFRNFDPRTPLGRRMIGVGAGGLAVETGGSFLADAILDPATANAPGRFETARQGSRVNPLQLNPATGSILGGLPAKEITMPDVMTNGTGMGLSFSRYQREANGIRVQWYLFDGQSMNPVDRKQAHDCAKKSCLYRFDLVRGRFVKLPQRRMNPMNVTAFFRAGRRIDAGERICRKMFSEKRRQRTGTIRRKSSRRKKR